MTLKEAFDKAIKANKKIRHPGYMGGQWFMPIVEDLGIRKLFRKSHKETIDMIPIDYADDIWETEEMWYEGDFKNKYPNGVLCLVRTGIKGGAYMACIKNYTYGCFIDDSGVHYENAIPVSPKNAPAIIGGSCE